MVNSEFCMFSPGVRLGLFQVIRFPAMEWWLYIAHGVCIMPCNGLACQVFLPRIQCSCEGLQIHLLNSVDLRRFHPNVYELYCASRMQCSSVLALTGSIYIILYSSPHTHPVNFSECRFFFFFFSFSPQHFQSLFSKQKLYYMNIWISLSVSPTYSLESAVWVPKIRCVGLVSLCFSSLPFRDVFLLWHYAMFKWKVPCFSETQKRG